MEKTACKVDEDKIRDYKEDIDTLLIFVGKAFCSSPTSRKFTFN